MPIIAPFRILLVDVQMIFFHSMSLHPGASETNPAKSLSLSRAWDISRQVGTSKSTLSGSICQLKFERLYRLLYASRKPDHDAIMNDSLAISSPGYGDPAAKESPTASGSMNRLLPATGVSDDHTLRL